MLFDYVKYSVKHSFKNSFFVRDNFNFSFIKNNLTEILLISTNFNKLLLNIF